MHSWEETIRHGAVSGAGKQGDSSSRLHIVEFKTFLKIWIIWVSKIRVLILEQLYSFTMPALVNIGEPKCE